MPFPLPVIRLLNQVYIRTLVIGTQIIDLQKRKKKTVDEGRETGTAGPCLLAVKNERRAPQEEDEGKKICADLPPV